MVQSVVVVVVVVVLVMMIDILIHAGRQRLQISVNYLRSAQARAELGTWISDLNPSCPKK